MKCIICKDKEALFCEDCCPKWRHQAEDDDYFRQLIDEYKNLEVENDGKKKTFQKGITRGGGVG